MPPRKQKPVAKVGANKAAAAANDEDLDALLDAIIRVNEAVPGSPAALRLEQEQREARNRMEQEQREAREKAEAEIKAAQQICGSCGAGGAGKKCGGCGSVQYCGEQCQRAHLAAHKARCRELKAEAEALAEAKAVREDEERYEVTFNPDTERGNCWTCGVDNPHHLCNGCKVTKYCGVACQTENWPIHKGRCADLKKQNVVADKAKDRLKGIKAAGARMSQHRLSEDLCNASMLGRIVDIERILAAGGRVNACDKGTPPLLCAAKEGHARAIHVLMGHGAHINAVDDMDRAALHVASEFGQLKAVAALLEHGAQVDLRDNRGGSSLYMASQNNHLEVAALLLGKGAQVNLPTNTGATPLAISAQFGYAAVARLLLEHGAHVDSSNDGGGGPLYVASYNNHPEVAALLLEKGAQVDLPDKGGFTPLLISAQQGHAAVVRLLLEHGAEVDARNKEGFSSLYYATRNDHPDVLDLLLKNGAKVDQALKLQEGSIITPLLIASIKGVVTCVRLLLQAGADPLQRTNDGLTPLIAATDNNHPEVVALLQARIAEIVREQRVQHDPRPPGPEC